MSSQPVRRISVVMAFIGAVVLAAGCRSEPFAAEPTAASPVDPVSSMGAALVDRDRVESSRCDRFAAPGGSDASPGTMRKPLLTAQALAESLHPGQTGCLRGGVYSADDQVDIHTRRVTLTSYPGERATILGRLWVTRRGKGATVSDLTLEGANDRGLPSPTVNGDDVTIAGNEITNGGAGICLSIGSRKRFGRAHRTLVVGNEIHGCGTLPPTNFDHGIYVNTASRTVIRGNWIHDNADRGVQLYPDSRRTRVVGNVIDANGEGVLFGGDERTASSDNLVESNVITRSRVRADIESSWASGVGDGNVARDNCVGPRIDRAVPPINHANGGFRSSKNEIWSGTGPPCGFPQ